MIKVFNKETQAEELALELAKSGAKHICVNGNEVTVYTGQDIPKD